jgi:hypothetical protein
MYSIPSTLETAKKQSGLYENTESRPQKFKELIGDSFDEQIGRQYMRAVKGS